MVKTQQQETEMEKVLYETFLACKTAEDVKALLTRQVSSSVRWQQSVETMLADGVDRFIEIGPGKTLAGFIRKINREATVINIEKFEDLEKLN